MKTSPSLKIFKFSTLVPLAIAIAAALVTQPIRAIPTETIAITETSSTSLTVTLNGSATGITVTNTASDQWLVSFSTSVFSIDFGRSERFNWTEPENSSQANVVYFGINGQVPSLAANELFIVSDTTPVIASGSLGNGGTTPVFATLGDPFNGGAFLNATFNDNAATAEATVPDTGSTLGLLSLSVVALLGATRLRFLQLAA